DSDGDSLTISEATASDGGTVTIENNALSYTSADTFLGTETISYSISDGNGGTASAEVTVDVSLTLTLTGVVTDEPIPNAAVVAT
ncbi:Ig-like domain-containing protein, partial [Thalassotalea ganghwensis]